MKQKLWVYQIPVFITFAFAFYIGDLGARGNLNSEFARSRIFPKLRRISGPFTDLKFKIRGREKQKNKIVIVEIDGPSLNVLGRWPWHRDLTAYLIEKTFGAGAKVIGLDMVFSEPDKRVPEELEKILSQKHLSINPSEFETDLHLKKIIDRYRDRLVLGWTSDGVCQPAYDGLSDCPVKSPEVLSSRPEEFGKFSIADFTSMIPFDMESTPFPSVITLLSNLPIYNQVAAHAGFFNTPWDPDSIIRRTNLIYMLDGHPYPSLALEMARVGLNDELSLHLNKQRRIDRLEFKKSGHSIPVTPLGVMDINFRGGGHSFTAISALDLLDDGDVIKGDAHRSLTGASKKALLQDAYVLIGVTALGVFDMRAFPFEENVPGVLGHASILDNLLSGDALRSTSSSHSSLLMFILILVGGAIFAFFTERLEAIPALLLFLCVFCGLGFTDITLLFERNYNWDSSFLYIEIFTVFILTLAAKYVIEERNKKFLRSAMARYVAPAIVDEIIRNPERLSLGGEKKELSILFSDIRGFTSFSEKMDAKALASLLNEYLELMTEVIFKHRGTVDKYIGDAIMAFWGAPLDQKDHALNACESALEMIRVLESKKAHFKEKYGIEIKIGIGINSGLVTVGNMGSKEKMNYTVVGDHVNLASRLEGLTKFYHVPIVTTRFTYDSILQAGGNLKKYRVLDQVRVKGKSKSVEIIEPVTANYPEDFLEIFEKARSAYCGKDWSTAIDAFALANKISKSKLGTYDGPSELYLKRCEEFRKNPPSQSWDGSWEMSEK